MIMLVLCFQSFNSFLLVSEVPSLRMTYRAHHQLPLCSQLCLSCPYTRVLGIVLISVPEPGFSVLSHISIMLFPTLHWTTPNCPLGLSLYITPPESYL